MRPYVTKPVSRIKGEIALSGDKSIAHRAVIISAISKGSAAIENFPANKDCLSTVSVFRQLGIRIIQKSSATFIVYGAGRCGLTKPGRAIFVGDSGTTLRLLLGVLAGQNFAVKLIAGKSLSQRPMRRVNMPLRMMGAKITATLSPRPAAPEEYPPITIKGGNLKTITYKMPVASAQVKSAVLLAGLYPKGITRVIEPIKTRDHTERMLKLFAADIKIRGKVISIKGDKELASPQRIYIPGDISSGSFFVVLASILPDSQILIRNVNLNPSRTGVMRVLKRMGANIRVSVRGFRDSGFEPMGDLLVKSSRLKGAVVKKEEIPSLIDELPILMVAACNAKGKTVLEGVEELRVKETDRIKSISENLRKMGADIQVVKSAKSEKIVIQGVKELKGSRLSSFADHRTAMSMVVAGLKAKNESLIDDIGCIDKSFPDFLDVLKKLIR